ncbi:MAG: OB-fold nucleic acid binding domain-containing protein [Methanoregulaceae archaeon]|nr:OB-fold nucleic acid binding domain-containing protein [Methanoregulaceae archaeon]
MQFHYALVDDLISREEFERRLEEKMQECGDLLDEVTAAMVVVQELGRSHVKIGGLSGGSSLFSFFGKVISISPAKEFTRQDGDKGWVAHLILADETGQVRAVLWDEKAAAAAEIEPGDVLEIIGKHTSPQHRDIVVLALRKSPCEIDCGVAVESRFVPPERKEVTVKVLILEEPRTVTQRDGSIAELVEGCVFDGETTARMVAWEPGLLADIPEGATIWITGALEKYRNSGKEYVVDEQSSIAMMESELPFQFNRLDDVRTEGTWSVEGTLLSLHPARAFFSRDGRQNHVRNLVITDGKTDLRIVIWGDRALIPLVPGDHLVLYNSTGRVGKQGGLELHIGGNGFIRVVVERKKVEVEMEGTVIITREGTFIDNGSERYLLSGEYPHGHEIRVWGLLAGDRITPVSVEEREMDPVAILAKVIKLTDSPAPDNTFTLHGRQDI